MIEKLRFLGLDVHAETITVAVAEADGEVRSLGTIANREESIRKLIRKLGPVEHLRACYEAGPERFSLFAVEVVRFLCNFAHTNLLLFRLVTVPKDGPEDHRTQPA